MQPNTDAELIDQVLNGNSQRAFKELVNRYQKMVMNTCRGFVPQYSDAQDISQEVFIEMYQSLGGFRGEARLSTWLYRIAVNKSLNHIRRNKRGEFFRSIEGLFRSGDSTDEPPQIKDTNAPNPEEKVLREEERKRIRAAIASLPDNQRIAFVLSRYQDLSYKEIAAVMDISLSAVESLLFRAKQNLQKKLGGKGRSR